MSSNEMTIEEARPKLGDLVIAAMGGRTTVLTRYGRPAAQINPIAQESPMPITVAELAAELGVALDDILALADQLVEIDGSEKVVAAEDRHSVTLTGDAAEAIREQLKPAAPAGTMKFRVTYARPVDPYRYPETEIELPVTRLQDATVERVAAAIGIEGVQIVAIEHADYDFQSNGNGGVKVRDRNAKAWVGDCKSIAEAVALMDSLSAR